jgi:hypothetical protein
MGVVTKALLVFVILTGFGSLPFSAALSGQLSLPADAPRPSASPIENRLETPDRETPDRQTMPPQVVPIPRARPHIGDNKPGGDHATPLPEKRMDGKAPDASGVTKPAEKPSPAAREAVEGLQEKPKRQRPSPPPAPAQLACQADLRKLGVRFEEKPPISDPLGCAIENPLDVTRFSASIAIKPGGMLDCAISDALSRFLTGTVSPEAEKVFGSPLAAIDQVSTYVCRDRHGVATMSEHAYGNAIDIARFVLKDGTAIDVKDYGDSDPKRSQFLADVRKAACGPFRTVLGPGADADHSLHFHFDLEPRHSLKPFCQ